MRHDPDRLAAEFLSGDLAGARRRLVERHLLDCDECWWEVAQARQGRHAAEALRLVTPPQVRDRIRAVVDLDSPIPRSGRTSGTVPSAAARRVLARPHLRWLPRPALAAALLTLSTAVVAAMVVFTRPGPDSPGGNPPWSPRSCRPTGTTNRQATRPPPPRLRDKPTGSSGPRPGASFSSANRSSCTSTAAPTAPGSCWLARRSSSPAPPARTTCRAGNGRPTSAESGSTAPPDPDRPSSSATTPTRWQRSPTRPSRTGASSTAATATDPRQPGVGLLRDHPGACGA